MTTTVADLVLAQIGKQYPVAVQALNDFAVHAEQQARSKNKAIAEEARGRRADLGRVLFWFHYAARADGTSPALWSAIRVLVQDFVDRGMLKPSVMDTF